MNELPPVRPSSTNPSEAAGRVASSISSPKKTDASKKPIDLALRSLTDQATDSEIEKKVFKASKFPAEEEIDQILKEVTDSQPPESASEVSSEQQLAQLNDLFDVQEKAPSLESEVEPTFKKEESQPSFKPLPLPAKGTLLKTLFSKTDQGLRAGLKVMNTHIVKAEVKAEKLIHQTLGAIPDESTRAAVTIMTLIGLRSHSAPFLAVKILNQMGKPNKEVKRQTPQTKGFRQEITEALQKIKPGAFFAFELLMKIRKESLSAIVREMLRKTFSAQKTFSDTGSYNVIEPQAELKTQNQKLLEPPLQGRVQVLEEENSITHLFQSSLVDLKEDHSAPPSFALDVPAFSFASTMVDTFKVLEGKKSASEVKDKASKGVQSLELDEKNHLEKMMELSQELISDELITGFVLGEENMDAYHGDLDQEYAKHLLDSLPSGSALLFSERTSSNDLIFVIATRDAEGNLKLYDDDFSQGFEWVAKDIKVGLGLNFVDKSELRNMAEKKWLRIVPEENAVQGASKVFLSPQRMAEIKNNLIIAEHSTYYRGFGTRAETEEFFKQIGAPIGTALLRYDNEVGSFFVTYVGTDENNVAVIRHERTHNLEKTLQDMDDLVFMRNELKAEDFLGDKKSFYFGEMSDAQAKEYLEGTLPEKHAVLYSRRAKDGRIQFFAGLNKKVMDQNGKETNTFVSYNIGNRPDFAGSWVNFYSQNHEASLVTPQSVTLAKHLVQEINNTPYNHHHIGKAGAEKLLQNARSGTAVLHTIGEGTNEQVVFSLKLPNSNNIVHQTLPPGVAFLGPFTEFLEMVYSQPVVNLPGSFDELFLQFHQKNLVFLPPPKEIKKSQLNVGMKIKRTFRKENSPFNRKKV